MSVQSILNILLYSGGVATFIFVGRSSIKKQTIQDLKDLVEAQGKTIDSLKQRIRFLEDLLWNSHLVDPRDPSGDGRGRRGSGPAALEPPDDEDT